MKSESDGTSLHVTVKAVVGKMKRGGGEMEG